jgi:diguanylate cyclase (GGDEF)-like protein/PAS domain S-box-containing protein
MRFFSRNYAMFMWIFIPCVIFLVDEAIEVALAYFFPDWNFWVFELIHSVISIGLLVILFLVFIQKGIQNTTAELSKSNQRLNNIFDTLDVAIWHHDLKGDNLMITSGIEKLYGFPRESFFRDHNLWKEVIHPNDLCVLDEREEKVARGEAVTSVYRIIRPDGAVRWIQDRGIPVLDKKGALIEFTSVLFDVTGRKESEDRYRSLVELSPDLIGVISGNMIVYINDAGCRLMGAARKGQLLGKPVSNFVDKQAAAEIYSTVSSGSNAAGKRRFEVNARRLDGSLVDVEVSSMPILYGGKEAVQVIGRDITERKQSEKTIEYMAFYDTLTGLPNRNEIMKRLQEILNSGKQKAAVLFLDLDRFKIINDTKGHSAGDLLLQKAAIRLEDTVGNLGLVARQGGDEFIILFEEKEKRQIEGAAGAIIEQFNKPFILEGEEFFITPSIGISLYPEHGTDQETLIKHADTAMYLAKERGKNNFQFYTPSLGGLASRKMALENGLRKALDREELLLHYQPQIDLKTGKLKGTEALVRWQYPGGGLVPPGEFIPLAEETGLIVPMGKWILRTACEQHKRWKEEGAGSIPIAVNISVRQLEDPDFIRYVKGVLSSCDIEPGCLELEITESIMQNIEKATVALNELKKIGIRLSIDDFGKGYSSLSYLKHLPIDTIKIDKSFVDDILDPVQNGSLVKAIIDMGLNLNFSVVAEGIEHKEQAEFLLKNNCPVGQGYYFSRPVTGENLKEFINKLQ